MLDNFVIYAKDTFNGVLTNSLFISVLYALIVFDLRKIMRYDEMIKRFNNIFLKIYISLSFYIFFIVMGLLIIFIIVFLLWSISEVQSL